MKISAIPAFTQKTLINRIQNNPQVSVPQSLKGLDTDTVSFSGSQANNSVTETFGLVKKNEKEFNLNNVFDVSQRINDEGKKILDTFTWDSQFGEVKFFGEEKTLAEHLKENRSDISSFDASSDANHSFIDYKEGNLRYRLKYSKDTHELVQASSAYTKRENDDNNTIERFVLYTSSKNPGRYAAQYQFIKDNNGESAYDNTDIAFDSDMNVEKIQSTKSFYYSDGEKTESDFEQIYDKNTGSVKTVDDRCTSRIY